MDIYKIASELIDDDNQAEAEAEAEARAERSEQTGLEDANFDTIMQSTDANKILRYAKTQATPNQIPSLWRLLIDLWADDSILRDFMTNDKIQSSVTPMFSAQMEQNLVNMYGVLNCSRNQ